MSVVLEIRVPFLSVPNIVRHPYYKRDPKRQPKLEKHPCPDRLVLHRPGQQSVSGFLLASVSGSFTSSGSFKTQRTLTYTYTDIHAQIGYTADPRTKYLLLLVLVPTLCSPRTCTASVYLRRPLNNYLAGTRHGLSLYVSAANLSKGRRKPMKQHQKPLTKKPP